MLAVEGGMDNALVGFVQVWLVEAKRAGQAAKELRVRYCLAKRRDGGPVQGDVGVAPRPQQVKVFDLRGSRKDVVGISRRVGHELLVDRGEQVLAGQAGAHPLQVGGNDRRIAGVDDEAVNGRRHRLAGERLAQLHHVDGANAAVLQFPFLGARLELQAPHNS